MPIQANSTSRTPLDKLTLFLAFGAGTGYLRPAPGTWGTLPGVLIAYWVMDNPYWHLGITLILLLLGIMVAGRATKILGVHDHGGIVIDEIVGVLITYLFFPASLPILIVGFLLFRLFDITKPPPIGAIDRHVHGGLGIMLDDVIAGMFAWLSLFLLLRYWPSLFQWG